MNYPDTEPVYSVVIPFYNEEGAVPELLRELRHEMGALRTTYEALFVDDGSTDGTLAALNAAVKDWPVARVLPLERNQGQATALLHGFAHACGLWIITLDGDGQNTPADIWGMLSAVQKYDMVVGIRSKRQDTWLRRKMSQIANRVRGKFLDDHLLDSGCALKIFRREVLTSFWPVRSLYSFMPAFAVAAGWSLAQVPVRHRERKTGKSKYGFGTFAWRPLVDMLALWWLLRHRRARIYADPKPDRFRYY